MIVTLKDTSTREISSRLETLHIHRGEAAQGRVLTLLINCPQKALEPALRTANETSWEHPCRVIAIVPGSETVEPTENEDGTTTPRTSRLDAEIRFGADAGASEIIVLRPQGELIRHLNTLVIPLMVADTPVVVWWPSVPPTNPSEDPLGRMAAVRITDVAETPDPMGTFRALRTTATPQDVDLSWTHLTLWRAQITAMLDQQPHSRVVSAEVTGQSGNLSVQLMAGWLTVEMGVPVTIVWNQKAEGIQEVRIRTEAGDFDLSRHDVPVASRKGGTANDADAKAGTGSTANDAAASCAEQAWVTTPNSSKPQMVTLPHRTRTECLSEELGRLYPDKVWAKVVTSNFSFDQKFADENGD